MSLPLLGLSSDYLLTTLGLGGIKKTYESIVLEIANHVSPTDKTQPLTGVYSQEQSIDGWQWNRRTIPSVAANFTRYLTYAGGHEAGLLDGTALKDWQSGVLSGISYDSLVHMPLGNTLTWTPRYKTGAFSVYWNSRVLYSDYSFSQNVEWNVDGRQQMLLRDDCVYNSIRAQLFERTSSYEIVAIREATLLSAFTGILVSEARLTLNEGVPADWSQVETRKREMVIDDNILYFNQDFSIKVGVGISAHSDSWQSMGPGLINGRPLFAKYLPLLSGSVSLISVDATGICTVWEEQSNLNFSGPEDEHFSVNYDLGVITTGGYKAPSLVLRSAVTAFSTEVQVVNLDDIDSYPEQGVLEIGSELVYYSGKTRNSFTNCVRGHAGTTAAAHLKGALVHDRQHGKGTTDDWYISYTATPRVDYEVSDYDLRSANHSTWLDVRAIANVKANNIVQIVSQDDNLAEIVLTTDSPLLGGNLFGPVYYGTDTSKLTATGYDASGSPVEDVELTIYIKSGDGKLNGSLDRFSADSNSLGQVHAFYNAPYNSDETTMEVTSTTHVGSDTHMTVNFTTPAQPNEVWVFQVLKHDPVLGSVGDFVDAFAAGTAAEPNGLGYVDVWMAHTEDYNGGTMLLEDATGVRRSLPIRWAEQQYDGNNEPYVRFFLDQSALSSWISGTEKCWLFQEEAVEWNSVLKRGARVILYEWTTNAKHPITGEVGAYMPVRPDSIQGNTLIFNNRLLAIPDSGDIENNLGAYVVVAPGEVRCSAYGRDPFSGNLITSNDVRLRLRLPNTLTGVDDSGALPIPHGWTLVTEEFNIGAGLDGANFLTVNPAASGINQFSITGVI